MMKIHGWIKVVEHPQTLSHHQHPDSADDNYLNLYGLGLKTWIAAWILPGF